MSAGVKARLAMLLSVAGLGLFGGAAAPSLEALPLVPSAAAHSCSPGWKHAAIGGKHKCLRAGQFCAKALDRQYHRYGYHCHTYDAKVQRHRLTRG